jgi:thiol-disulfide isomerase/thioredoxin
MRHRLIVASVLGLLGALALSVSAAAPKVGEKATFSYKTTDGHVVTQETVSGHVTIIDFWATWCGPCMAAAPHMVELNKTYASKGLVIIGVSLDADAKDMANVAKQEGFTWPQICDGKAWKTPFATAWEIDGIPHCFILGPDGTVLFSDHPGRMDRALKDAMEKYPYHAKETAPPKSAATETPPLPVVASKPAPTGVAPALLDSKLAAADKDKAAGRNVEAYEAYKWIAKQAPDTPQAEAAKEKVAAYDADAAFAAEYKKAQRTKDASSTLWLAQSLEKSGKIEQAKTYYAQLVKDFGDTPSAAAAKEALGRLK